MKRLLAFLFAAAPMFGQGSVSVSVGQVGISDTSVVVFTWTAASDGSVPVTTSSGLPANLQGYWPLSAETSPGSPSPTAGYAVAVLDGSGTDILSGVAGSLSSTVGQSWQVASQIPPLNGQLTLRLTGNAVAGASGRVFVYLSKAFLNRGGGGAGQGTVTHSLGSLLLDQPVFGNGLGDIKSGTKTGNTNKVMTYAGAAPVLGDCGNFDSDGNWTKATCGGGGGGSPSGPDTAMQSNNAGSFFGDSNVLYVRQVATPATPAISNIGLTGSTSYSYQIVARNGVGQTAHSLSATTTTGFAILDGTNYNRIATLVATGVAYYDVYRVVSAGTPSTTGYIGSVTAGSAFNDNTGSAGDGTTPPVSNTTIGLKSLNGFTNGTVPAIFGSNQQGAPYVNPPGIDIQLKGQFVGTATLQPTFVINAAGSDFGQMGNLDSTTFFLGHGPNSRLDGTPSLTWNNAGRVAVPGSFSVASLSGVGLLVAGVLGVVPGSASDCVHVDGSSGVCASGTGTVTHTGSLGSGRLIKGNGGADITVGDLTGDVTTSGGLATVLATVNASIGLCGDSTHVPQLTLTAKGLVTLCTPVAISGGGGGATSVSQLTDWQATRSTSTVLTVTGGNCLIGNTSTPVTGSATLTISAGTGTVRASCDKSTFPPTLKIYHDALTIACVGMSCNNVAGSAYGADDSPVFQWTATSGTWDTSGLSDWRGIVGGYRAIPGAGLSTSTSNGTETWNLNPVTRGIPFSIGDPGGTALTAASTTTDYITVPFACTISAYNLLVDAGTVTVKFWKIATGTAIPTVANSINTSGVGIASGTAIHSITLSDFTSTTVAANDVLAMNVVSVATAKYVSGVLQCDQ